MTDKKDYAARLFEQKIGSKITNELLKKLGIKKEEKEYFTAFLKLTYIAGFNDGDSALMTT